MTELSSMSTMTRKRFEEIVGLFTREQIRTEEELREELKRILNYDPSKSTYSAKRGEQIVASRRRRAAELGITVSQYMSGRYKKTGADPEVVRSDEQT